jgi:hypothetical protein
LPKTCFKARVWKSSQIEKTILCTLPSLICFGDCLLLLFALNKSVNFKINLRSHSEIHWPFMIMQKIGNFSKEFQSTWILVIWKKKFCLKNILLRLRKIKQLKLSFQKINPQNKLDMSVSVSILFINKGTLRTWRRARG